LWAATKRGSASHPPYCTDVVSLTTWRTAIVVAMVTVAMIVVVVVVVVVVIADVVTVIVVVFVVVTVVVVVAVVSCRDIQANQSSKEKSENWKKDQTKEDVNQATITAGFFIFATQSCSPARSYSCSRAAGVRAKQRQDNNDMTTTTGQQ
jgi:hypothetical protein